MRSRALPVLVAVLLPVLVAVSLLQLGGATPVPSLSPGGATPGPAGHAALRAPSISPNDHNDTSPPLRGMPPATGGVHLNEQDEGELPHPAIVPGALDTVIQSTLPAPRIPATATNFDGMVAAGYAPPDTNGAVGPSQYVQIVNASFEVLSKSGTILFGPVAINTLWTGFGGGCQTNNNGDPTVRYDRLADRWIITQFSVTTTPYLECVAVSATGDPTGAYYRYSFNYGSTAFPDYPKLGVWPDAYYETFNMFTGGTTFAGAQVCAYDRTKMLAGLTATQQCFTTSATYGGLLPSDLDGTLPPPAGSPNYLVALGATTTSLATWKFHVDWATPANSTFTGPASITVPAYAEACGGRTCIPQSGTTNQLDSLADRLMYRLAYRNFGDHESLVVNHSVTAGTSVGVRWYELRVASGTLSLFQAGTYAPDASYRWMGSIAQDQAGDMALGYSVSSSSLHPAIAYTGRLAGDTVGQMTQGEATIIAGAGAQTGSLTRWGDYSAMSVDPSDDCTFWYTNEYIPANGTFNWQTRIASFKFPGCGPAPTVTSVVPASGPLAGGTTVTITGTGFTGATGVSFGGTAAASYSVSSGTQISAVSPAGTGTVDVTVTGPGGTSATSTADQFTYLAAPTVTSIAPTSGPLAGGTTVTITGTGFTGATGVSFGGTAAASYSVSSGTQISAVSPAGTGTVDVTVTGPGGTSATSTADQFTYLAAPTVTSIAPTSGPLAGGTTVTITGTGFTGATGVSFGGTAAASYSVSSGTQISAVSPAGTGTVDVTVTGPGGTSATSTADQFTYLAAPTVTSIAPTSGPLAGGTTVTITGTGFTGATGVSFGGTAAASYSVSSGTQISAVSPAGTGTVDVTVTGPGGTSATSTADQFTYVSTTAGATYVPLTPARILDSRYGTGLSGAFSSHVARTFQVTGVGGVPTGATAVTGNLTVTQQTSLGFLYLGPVAQNNPTSSTLNFPTGDDRANGVTVALGAGGTLSVTYAAPTLGPTAQVIFDVTGYFVPDATGATYVPLTPARILDSRYGTGLSGAFSSHVARTFQVTGVGGVPSNATAVTGNLTVTQQTSLGFLYLGPVAQNNPTSSTLNFPTGDDRANGVTVALGAGGTLSVTYAAPTLGPTAQVIFDVTGYFVPDATGATYVPLTPARILDSRYGTGLSGAFSSHVARTFQVTGVGGVPSNATAVTGNLTVTQQTSLGFLYLGPVAQNNPTSSTLNFPTGDDRANGVTVALGAGGTLSVTYAAPTLGPTAQVIFDVTGYFVP